MPGVFVRRGEGIQRHTEDSHVGTEAKAAVMQPQAEECTGRPEASRGREGALETSVAPSEGARPCQHLSVRLCPPKLRDSTFLSFRAPSQFTAVCRGSSRKLTKESRTFADSVSCIASEMCCACSHIKGSKRPSGKDPFKCI